MPLHAMPPYGLRHYCCFRDAFMPLRFAIAALSPFRCFCCRLLFLPPLLLRAAAATRHAAFDAIIAMPCHFAAPPPLRFHFIAAISVFAIFRRYFFIIFHTFRHAAIAAEIRH